MVAQKVMMNKIMTSRHYAITLNKLKMCMADKHWQSGRSFSSFSTLNCDVGWTCPTLFRLVLHSLCHVHVHMFLLRQTWSLQWQPRSARTHFIVSLFFQSRRLSLLPVGPPCFIPTVHVDFIAKSVHEQIQSHWILYKISVQMFFHDILLHRLPIANRSLPTYFDFLAWPPTMPLRKVLIYPTV